MTVYTPSLAQLTKAEDIAVDTMPLDHLIAIQLLPQRDIFVTANTLYVSILFARWYIVGAS